MVVMFIGAECTPVSEGAEVTEFTTKERRKRRRTEKKSLGYLQKEQKLLLRRLRFLRFFVVNSVPFVTSMLRSKHS